MWQQVASSKHSQFAGRSKTKHIDCRQRWLECCGTATWFSCVHVSTEYYDLAELFAKSLDMPRCVQLTAKCRDGMVPALSALVHGADRSAGQGGEEQGSQGVLAETTAVGLPWTLQVKTTSSLSPTVPPLDRRPIDPVNLVSTVSVQMLSAIRRSNAHVAT